MLTLAHPSSSSFTPLIFTVTLIILQKMKAAFIELIIKYFTVNWTEWGLKNLGFPTKTVQVKPGGG